MDVGCHKPRLYTMFPTAGQPTSLLPLEASMGSDLQYKQTSNTKHTYQTREVLCRPTKKNNILANLRRPQRALFHKNPFTKTRSHMRPPQRPRRARAPVPHVATHGLLEVRLQTPQMRKILGTHARVGMLADSICRIYITAPPCWKLSYSRPGKPR